ncbi:MAG: hypothetical protein ABSG51_06005, partial [Terracidiphilus sp.]
MKELDEIEEKIHLGNVVSVEPMPERLAPVQNQADMPEIEVAGDDRMKIALRIVDLSNGVLEPEESGRHVALR